MRTQNYRSRTQNSSITRRRNASATASAVSGKNNRPRSTSRGSRNKAENRKHGTRAIWVLMFVGGMIATGFVLAQRSQINAHQLKHVEENLKSELDTLSSQQRYLIFQKERALSTRESDRAAKESGLVQLKLDRANARQVQQEPEAQTESKTVAKTSERISKQTKHSGQTIQSGKATMSKSSRGGVKLSNKQAESVKVNKANKTKSAQAGKAANKGKTRQLAQNQSSHKASAPKDKRR